jgi:hypothetical protein
MAKMGYKQAYKRTGKSMPSQAMKCGGFVKMPKMKTGGMVHSDTAADKKLIKKTVKKSCLKK